MKKPHKNSSKIGAKKLSGICMLVLGVLFFVLCIFPSFLGIGRFFQALFGVMAYPLFLLVTLVGLAFMMNMSYSFNKKFTSYLVVSLLSILCLLHTIFTSNVLLEKFTNFSQFGEYLAHCYHLSGGITVGGASLGILVYFFRALIGLGGTYVLFAVLATVFVGLVIDYLIYSKKQGKKVKIIEKKESYSLPEGFGEKQKYSFDEKTYQDYSFDEKEEEVSQEEKPLSQSIFETTFDPEPRQEEKIDREFQPSSLFTSNIEESAQAPSQEDQRTKARDLLFGNSSQTQENDKTLNEENTKQAEPKSAREVLFGSNDRAIPNIFDRNSDERNDWRRQYASKTLHFREEPTSEPVVPEEQNQDAPQTSYEKTEDGAVKTSWGTYRPTTLREDRNVIGSSDNFEQNSQMQSFDKINQDSSERLSNFGRPIERNLFERERQENENIPESRVSHDNFRNDLNPIEQKPAFEEPRRISREENLRNAPGQVEEQRNLRMPETNGRFDVQEQRISSPNRNITRQNNTISNINQKTEQENEIPNTDFGSRLTSQNRRVRGDDLLADASSLGISSTRAPMDQAPTSFSQAFEQSRPEERPVQREKPKVEKISFESQLNREYKAPPSTLLKVTKEEHKDYSQEYKQKSAILEQTLETFKIPAKVINVVRGPKVTRYELSMPIGIPVSRVLSYEKDMSMNLAAKNGIRIEAPIPGKNAFGVEVANDITSMVGFRELIESPEFRNFKGMLPVAIGKNISGEVVIKSLPKMVHCLVAGSTGSGKSVYLHTLIMSLMFKHSPDELRFIMIDPKRVEFSRYNRMPHLMLPEVVTDCSKAVNSLNWAVKEMERRFQLLMENECQKIDQYNELPKVKNGEEKRMPFLVIIVDELAELMGVAKKDVEGKIQRITQLGRACGIHMVVATQRPSVDVVTGVIKNNMPTRIAFSLSSYVDSKTILDEAGAEKLLGQGDMLFSGQDSNQKIRLQGAFVSDEEIKAVLDYIKENNVSEYDEEIQKSIYAEPEKPEADEGEDKSVNPEDRMDEYMPQALKLVMKNGKASISMIQRRFCVGYARAARIIDQMETRGFIDSGLGNKPRDVKITIAEYNELFGDFNSDN